MRSFGSRPFAHYAPLIAAAALLCVGIFLCWPAHRSQFSNTYTKADAHQIAQGADGNQHPQNGSYLVMLAEEAGDSDKGPVDADLLTALLAFFVTTVGWLLAYDHGREMPYSSGITRCPPFLSARKATPFLGVFRL